MEQQSELRASDRDRQAVADRLRVAVDEGRLDLSEYDERLTATYAAKTYGELAKITADLPPPRPAGSSGLATAAQIAEAAKTGDGRRPVPVPRRSAPWRPWLTVAAITTAIWFLTGADVENFWPMWVIVPWGLVLLLGTIGGGVCGPRHYHRYRG